MPLKLSTSQTAFTVNICVGVTRHHTVGIITGPICFYLIAANYAVLVVGLNINN